MIKAIMRLEALNYKKSNRFIVPLLIYFIYFELAYRVGPVELVSSYALQGIVLFFIMLIVAVTFCDSEHEEIQQIMIVKLGKEKQIWLYISKLFLLGSWELVLSILALIYPLIKYFSSNQFLTVTPSATDIIIGFLIINLFGLLGILLGFMLNNNVIKDRRLQICLILLCALVAIVGNRITEDFGLARYILWIIPPIGTITKWIKHSSSLTWDATKALLLCCAYSVVYISLYLTLMMKPSKKKYIKYTNTSN